MQLRSPILAAGGIVLSLAVATPAQADRDYRRGHGPYWRHHHAPYHYHEPRAYYAPPPVYYAPPAYYAQPRYYPPPRPYGYGPPGIYFGFR